ncbi:MAG: hypothetical protein HOJ38_00840, partial [Rhodobiaceae bacterium]|nr:hypothetical protein [Rhodobiaceae bacterium]
NSLDNELNDDTYNYDLHGFESENKDDTTLDETIDFKEPDSSLLDKDVLEKEDENLEIPAFLRRQVN